MAHKKHNQLVPSPEWWKHLKEYKRLFWKRERKAAKRLIEKERNENRR